MITIRLNTWKLPYRISWKSKRTKAFAPKLDCITFFDKARGKDAEIAVTRQDLEWSITSVKGTSECDVSADGTIDVEIDAPTLKRLKKAGRYDYVLKLFPGRSDADRDSNAYRSGQDYEFVENTSVELDIVEAPAKPAKGTRGALTAQAIAESVGLVTAQHLAAIQECLDHWGESYQSLEEFMSALSLYNMMADNTKTSRARKELLARGGK